jgi:hypothetical protein
MKKRTHSTTRTDRTSLVANFTGSLVMSPDRPRTKRPPAPPVDDDPRLTVLKGPEFDRLLALIDNPPEPSEELRREVAQARLWK